MSERRPARRAARPPAPPSRPARVRAAVASFAGRLFEVVDTDMLVWEATRDPRPARSRVEVELVPAGAGAGGGWRELLPDSRAREVDAFLRRGDSGWIGLVHGRFAGWVWVSRVTHRDPWSGLVIRLAPDELYAYALWVEHEHRPAGVAGVLMTAMLSSVQADPGLTRVYGWVDTRNRESQMLLRLLGFKDVQHVKRVHVARRLGRQLPRSDKPAYGPLSARGRHSDAPDGEPT